MNKLIDLVGQRFGQLLVIERRSNNSYGQTRWLCQCDCGNKTIVYASNMRSGHTQSCGCLQKKLAKESHTKHKMCGTPTYNTWGRMIQRCNDKKDVDYKDYGGRGITVCSRWLEFENFFEDMGTRPDGLSIERVNNNKGYSPDNCKWATSTEQNRNKRLGKNNKTGIAGVNWHKRYQRYCVRIGVNCKRLFIGRFVTLEQAIIARKQAEQKYWGKRC